MSDATDAVVLHLWQAVQVVIDMAISACVRRGLGSPPTYGDAFRRLGEHGLIDEELAARLARAAGFRNLVVHAYADLDLERLHRMATTGPGDLRAFLAALRDLPPAGDVSHGGCEAGEGDEHRAGQDDVADDGGGR